MTGGWSKVGWEEREMYSTRAMVKSRAEDDDDDDDDFETSSKSARQSARAFERPTGARRLRILAGTRRSVRGISNSNVRHLALIRVSLPKFSLSLVVPFDDDNISLFALAPTLGAPSTSAASASPNFAHHPCPLDPPYSECAEPDAVLDTLCPPLKALQLFHPWQLSRRRPTVPSNGTQ